MQTVPVVKFEDEYDAQFKKGNPLPYGHHLIFFHHSQSENSLRADMSNGGYAPPDPFVRRMWAGGSFSWAEGKHLRIGETYLMKTEITNVEKKAFDTDNPKVFVHRKLTYFSPEDKSTPIIEETRTHVYLTEFQKSHKKPKTRRVLSFKGVYR